MSRGEGPAQQEQQQQDTEQHQQQEDPSPENVLAGLQVQEKNLRELRKYLFSRLFQLQAEEAVLRSKLPEDLRRQDRPEADAVGGHVNDEGKGPG